MNTKKQQNTESLELLKAKKEKDGKLSRIGEWLLSGKSRELGEIRPQRCTTQYNIKINPATQ